MGCETCENKGWLLTARKVYNTLYTDGERYSPALAFALNQSQYCVEPKKYRKFDRALATARDLTIVEIQHEELFELFVIQGAFQIENLFVGC
jgi:hypothetical protein